MGRYWIRRPWRTTNVLGCCSRLGGEVFFVNAAADNITFILPEARNRDEEMYYI